MRRGERIALWAITGLLGLGVLVGFLVVGEELSAIKAYLVSTGESQEDVDVEPTPWWAEGAASGEVQSYQVGIAGVEALSGTVAMTVTARSAGAGDLLYEPPVLVDERGYSYQISAESLEGARLAFLDLITRGQAVARLEFAGWPGDNTGLWLVLNPGQQPGNLVAPRVEVAVPIVP